MSYFVTPRYENNGQASGAPTVELARIAGCQQDRLAGQLAELEGLVDDLAIVVGPPLVPVPVKQNLDGHIGVGS